MVLQKAFKAFIKSFGPPQRSVKKFVFSLRPGSGQDVLISVYVVILFPTVLSNFILFDVTFLDRSHVVIWLWSYWNTAWQLVQSISEIILFFGSVMTWYLGFQSNLLSVLFCHVQVLVKEEDRLAVVIDNICQDVAIVPRGAYLRTPLGEVMRNRMFDGRSIFINFI